MATISSLCFEMLQKLQLTYPCLCTDEGMRLTCHFCSGHSKSNPKRYFYRCRNGTCVQARSEGQNARQGLAVCDREACVDLLVNYFNAHCPKCASVCCCVKDSSGKWYHRCVDHQLPECPCKNKRKQPDSRGVVDIASAQRVEAQRSGASFDGNDTESVRQTFSRMSNSHMGPPGIPPSPAFGNAPTPASSAAGGHIPPQFTSALSGNRSNSGGALPTFGAGIGDPAGSRKRRAGTPLEDHDLASAVGGGGDGLRHIPGLGGIFGDELPSRRGSNLSDREDDTAGLRMEVATLREFVQNMAGNLHHLTQHQDATVLGVRRISSDIHNLSDRLAALEISQSARPTEPASGSTPAPEVEVDSEHVARVQAFNHQISKIMSHVHGYFDLRQRVDAALDDSALPTVPRGTLSTMSGKLQTLHSRLGRLRAILASGGNKFSGAFMDLADLTRWQSLVFAEISWLDQVKTMHAQQSAGMTVAAGASGNGPMGLPSAAPAGNAPRLSGGLHGMTSSPPAALQPRSAQVPTSNVRTLQTTSHTASAAPASTSRAADTAAAAPAVAVPAKPESQSGRTNSETDLVGMGSTGAPQSYAEHGNFGLGEDDDLDLTGGGLDFGLGGGAHDGSRDIFSFEGDGDGPSGGAGGGTSTRHTSANGGETPVPQQQSAHSQDGIWGGRGPSGSFGSSGGDAMFPLTRESSNGSSGVGGVGGGLSRSRVMHPSSDSLAQHLSGGGSVSGRERARSGGVSSASGGPSLEPPRQSFL